ncbi:MAG: alkaline phosphatase family protein, partial [Pirellulaceae bacterium]|nr:alkaline phosphatase family protein [Pirellulaceae bacterium]
MVAESAEHNPDSLTLFLILDAFRYDYLEHAPYLTSLANWRGRVRETFGFVSTRPAMWAGVYPEESDICFEYKFCPQGPTFRSWWCRVFRFLATIIPDRQLRLAASAWLRATSRSPIARRTGLVGHMPFDWMPLFEYAEKRLPTDPRYLSTPSIFNLLNDRNQHFLYHGFARPKRRFEILKRLWAMGVRGDLMESDRTMVEHVKVDLRRSRPHLVHMHFSACDWIGHRFGPDSVELKQAIRRVDELVAQVHDAARQSYRQVRILATADHGMVGVKRHHDMSTEVLDGLPFRQPDDFLIFRDSTIARFWFFRPDAEEAIRRRLADVSWGRVLGADDLQQYRIRFRDNANGDLLFLLDPGEVLLP